jgi:hypothetical protein
MSTFKIFDGTNWVDPCDCNISILAVDGVTYQQINPNNCIVSYFDGTNWCPITCPCQCPAGYTFNPATNSCESPGTFEPAIPSGGTTVPVVTGDKSPSYGSSGTRLYEDISGKVYPLNGWHNAALCPLPPPSSNAYCSAGFQVCENAGVGTTLTIQATSPAGNQVFSNSPSTTTKGRLNVAGLWATGYGVNEWLTVEFCINIASTKTYIFAIAGDNQIRASITSTTFNGGVTDLNLVNLWGATNPSGTATNSNAVRTFTIWHMFPITLPAGNHIIKLAGYDFSPYVAASFAAEIYDIPVGNVGDVWPTQQTMHAFLQSTSVTTTDLEPFLAFTTRDLIQTPPLLIAAPGETITWSCNPGEILDFCNGAPQCIVPGDSIPCGQGAPLSSTTEINIWFDNSGSMNTTLQPLQIMQSTLLQACLLPIYNNDVALYNERVKVLNMSNGSAWNYNERFVRCLATERNFNRAVDTSVDQVLNLTFADESNVYGYGGGAPFDNNSRTTPYDNDITTLRNVMTTVAYTIKGTAFRINTGPGSYPGFRGLTQATFINTGVYSPPNNVSDYYSTNFNCNLDTLAGSTPVYYRDQIVAALTALGISIPVCP